MVAKVRKEKWDPRVVKEMLDLQEARVQRVPRDKLSSNMSLSIGALRRQGRIKPEP